VRCSPIPISPAVPLDPPSTFALEIALDQASISGFPNDEFRPFYLTLPCEVRGKEVPDHLVGEGGMLWTCLDRRGDRCRGILLVPPGEIPQEAVLTEPTMKVPLLDQRLIDEASKQVNDHAPAISDDDRIAHQQAWTTGLIRVMNREVTNRRNHTRAWVRSVSYPAVMGDGARMSSVIEVSRVYTDSRTDFEAISSVTRLGRQYATVGMAIVSDWASSGVPFLGVAVGKPTLTMAEAYDLASSISLRANPNAGGASTHFHHTLAPLLWCSDGPAAFNATTVCERSRFWSARTHNFLDSNTLDLPLDTNETYYKHRPWVDSDATAIGWTLGRINDRVGTRVMPDAEHQCVAPVAAACFLTYSLSYEVYAGFVDRILDRDRGFAMNWIGNGRATGRTMIAQTQIAAALGGWAHQEEWIEQIHLAIRRNGWKPDAIRKVATLNQRFKPTLIFTAYEEGFQAMAALINYRNTKNPEALHLALISGRTVASCVRQDAEGVWVGYQVRADAQTDMQAPLSESKLGRDPLAHWALAGLHAYVEAYKEIAILVTSGLQVPLSWLHTIDPLLFEHANRMVGLFEATLIPSPSASEIMSASLQGFWRSMVKVEPVKPVVIS
jgi:hypothetical protein